MIPKFRAWDNWRKRMSVVDRIYMDTKGVRLYYDFGEYWRDFRDVELTQSTGLKDKNGKEIFEGDILAFETDDEVINVNVFWDEEHALFMFESKKYNEQEPLAELVENNTYPFEIIGNIYENSELLEVNDILKELGDDYGSMKYRSGADKIRQELNKPVIPQFVAEIIEYYKGQNATLYDALREKNFNKQYNEWLLNEQDAYNKVARAWLDGYEVEKEKRYTVRIKGVEEDSAYLKHKLQNNHWYYGSLTECSLFSPYHIKKELEEAGFGWVFDCEGVEVQEVEG